MIKSWQHCTLKSGNPMQQPNPGFDLLFPGDNVKSWSTNCPKLYIKLETLLEKMFSGLTIILDIFLVFGNSSLSASRFIPERSEIRERLFKQDFKCKTYIVVPLRYTWSIRKYIYSTSKKMVTFAKLLLWWRFLLPVFPTLIWWLHWQFLARSWTISNFLILQILCFTKYSYLPKLGTLTVLHSLRKES